MHEATDSAFTAALEKYVIGVTPFLREIKSLGLPLRTILFGVIGRFHHEMERGILDLNLAPIEAYAYGLNKVMHDPHVNELMSSMMQTGVNAAVNNMLEM